MIHRTLTSIYTYLPTTHIQVTKTCAEFDILDLLLITTAWKSAMKASVNVLFQVPSRWGGKFIHYSYGSYVHTRFSCVVFIAHQATYYGSYNIFVVHNEHNRDCKRHFMNSPREVRWLLVRRRVGIWVLKGSVMGRFTPWYKEDAAVNAFSRVQND